MDENGSNRTPIITKSSFTIFFRKSCCNSVDINYKYKIIVPTRNCCTPCVGSPGIIRDRTPDCYPVSPGHGCRVDLTSERGFDSQTTYVIYVPGLRFDMLFTGMCATRHWQTSDRLVNELNACTVNESSVKVMASTIERNFQMAFITLRVLTKGNCSGRQKSDQII